MCLQANFKLNKGTYLLEEEQQQGGFSYFPDYVLFAMCEWLWLDVPFSTSSRNRFFHFPHIYPPFLSLSLICSLCSSATSFSPAVCSSKHTQTHRDANFPPSITMLARVDPLQKTEHPAHFRNNKTQYPVHIKWKSIFLRIFPAIKCGEFVIESLFTNYCV